MYDCPSGPDTELTPCAEREWPYNQLCRWFFRVSTPHLLHYRGRHPQQCRSNAQGLNDIMSQLGALFPDSIIEAGPAAREKYVEELQHSRFCLVVRCDYSYRSRLYDSVAAGCVPVLINDGWHLTVAPFADAGLLRYADFTLTLPESMFLVHPPSVLSYIYTMSECGCMECTQT